MLPSHPLVRALGCGCGLGVETAPGRPGKAESVCGGSASSEYHCEDGMNVKTSTDQPIGLGSKPKRVRVPGRFGVYGGRYVPETLMAALQSCICLRRGAKLTAFPGP